MYLGWYDDNPKHTIAQKIADAIAAYRQRYGVLPNIALVSEADGATATVEGIGVRVERRVQRNNVQVGVEVCV